MKLTQKTIGLTMMALTGTLFATATLAEMMPFHGRPAVIEADADGDGKVSKAEFETWRAARATALDGNKDGLISAEELAAARVKAAEAGAKAFAEAMIARLDSDKDAKLSAAELAAGPMPGFERMDRNGDGVLDEAELTRHEGRHGGKHGGKHGGGKHHRGGDHGKAHGGDHGGDHGGEGSGMGQD